MLSELLTDLEEIEAKCRGSAIDRHVAFLHLRRMLPEVIAALRER